jgi:hypothetical protein
MIGSLDHYGNVYIHSISKRQAYRLNGIYVSIHARKMLRTTHKGGSQEVSHVQKFNKQAGWLRKNGAATSLSGSGLK